MRCAKRNIIAVILFGLLALFPSVTFATTEPSCECFCGVDGEGATDQGPLKASECSALCKKKDMMAVGCFSDESKYPYYSDKCWTSSECSTWSDTAWDGTTRTATWGETMPYDCSVNKSGTEEMRYCYAKPTPYTLNIPIGTVKTATDIPSYINLIYAWLLPAASLVAVVMMMIGGLQYVLSRGKAKYIDKAKTRITNAITGIVLLMSAYVLLNLIDPRLVAFKDLQIPLIKEVTVLDATSSCERLYGYGYDITLDSGSSAQCGGTGKISGDSRLKQNTIGSWKVGDSCDYTYCEANKSCVNDDGKKSCQSCLELKAASSGACAALESFDPADSYPPGDIPGNQNYCSYDAATASCATVGTGLGTSSGFNCSVIREKASASDGSSEGIVGCGAYNSLSYGYDQSKVVSVPNADGIGEDLFSRACEEDLCNIGKDIESDGTDVPVYCVYDSTIGCTRSLTSP